MSVGETDLRGDISTRESLLLVAGICLALMVLMLPGAFLIPGRDAGVFLYLGQGILQGEVPYLDAWDHKPPLIFFTYALGLLGSAGRLWGPAFLELFSIGLAAWMLWRLLHVLHGRTPALIVTVLWILVLPDLRWRGGFTECFTLPLQMAVPWLLLAWRRRPEMRRWPLLLGALAGAAFLYRQNHIAIFVAAFPVATLFLGSWRGMRRTLQSFLWCCAGAAAVILPFALYFLVLGAWSEMWDAAFTYNFLYTGVSWADRLQAMGKGIERIPWSSGALLVWLLVGLRLLWKRGWIGGSRGVILLLAWIALPLEFYVATASGRTFNHYYILWLPVLALLLAELFRFLDRPRFLSGNWAHGSRIFAAVMVVVVLMELRFYAVEDMYQRLTDDQIDLEVSASASYLRSHSSSDQSCLVWGSNALTLAVANRRSSSRLVYQYPLITRGYHQDELAREFVQQLRDDPPAVIIDTGHRYFPSLDIERRKSWELPNQIQAHIYGPPSVELAAFFEQVDRDYEKVEEFDHFEIYVPRKKVVETESLRP